MKEVETFLGPEISKLRRKGGGTFFANLGGNDKQIMQKPEIVHLFITCEQLLYHMPTKIHVFPRSASNSVSTASNSCMIAGIPYE
ncbi:hypothetical protein ACFSF2_08540 [Paenibacillus rhizophilus]